MQEIEQHSIIISQASLKKSLLKDEIDNLVAELGNEEKKLTSKHSLLIFDAEAVAGITHLKACIRFAIKAFKQNANIARKLNAEILLYLSGNRQISKAFPKVGITPSTMNVLMLQIVDSSVTLKALKQFDFKSFFERISVEIQDIKMNIDTIEINNVEKVLKNLEISGNVIQMYLQTKSISSADFSIIEKLAIEKSALLNLEK
ncbi:MAG: hypothetical protein KGD59_06195 [Candidatus Heimdallarchaeota archaeon]|nr:hypothetical protein [Candidatus Heimdallarchaeota archaeon]MBY8994123.1 hypothetical protein [Candidatus Heimdallarchaeota archaeon]